jgi:hypothetical protein
MWLPKDEEETLVFYYRQFAAGNIPPTPKQPWDDSTHRRLDHRDLINITYVNHKPLVTLTQKGIDLGQIYNSWWLRSKLWYEQYIKNHPIILLIVGLVSYIAGIMSMLLVNWLSSFFGAK